MIDNKEAKGIWWCVVDGQRFVHSVWGNSLEADAKLRCEQLLHQHGWSGIRVVKRIGSRPNVGQQIKEGRKRV